MSETEDRLGPVLVYIDEDPRFPKTKDGAFHCEVRLWDLYAAAGVAGAYQILLACQKPDEVIDIDVSHVAEEAAGLADALLAERRKRESA